VDVRPMNEVCQFAKLECYLLLLIVSDKLSIAT